MRLLTRLRHLIEPEGSVYRTIHEDRRAGAAAKGASSALLWCARAQCPIYHASMRIIALINDACTVEKILDRIGESTQSPCIAPARRPPLWEAAAAQQANNDPQWDWSAPPVPDRVRSTHRRLPARRLMRAGSGCAILNLS